MKGICAVVLFMVLCAGCSRQAARHDAPAGIISSSNAPAAIGPYSQAVRVGDRLYLSGQLGLDPATGTFAGPEFETQARQALENQKAVLETAGFSLGDVVQCQVFLTDMNHYPVFNAVYTEYFNRNFPARAVVEVSRLPIDGLVEIMMIADRATMNN